MTDDQPTRALGDPDDGDGNPTVELRRRPAPAPGDAPFFGGDTQVIPDDLEPSPDPGAGGYRDLNDTQPIGVGDRWTRRRPPQPRTDRGWGRRPAPPPAAPRPEDWDRRARGPDWERPLPPAGREPGFGPVPERPAPGRAGRRGRHLLVWVFTLLVAVGLGAAAVLGPWAEPLGLSPQATTLGVIVASLVAWILLSAVLRVAGIVAFVVTPLLYLAGSVPELRRLPVDLPAVGGAATLLAMALGVASWLAGHWFFYARKGWWRSRVAGALLGAIPGVESAARRPERPYDRAGGP